jgi:hypothetical protein
VKKLRSIPGKTKVFYSVMGAAVLVFAGLAATSVYGTPGSAASSVQRPIFGNSPARSMRRSS